MSKQLGPVHYRMYEKIKEMDHKTELLLQDQGESLRLLNQKVEPVSKEALDVILDQENIHGWLSSKIDQVELRYAWALAQSREPLKKLEDYGKSLKLGAFSSPEELFQTLLDVTLDGMPCDGALAATTDGDGSLLLHMQKDTHEKYVGHLEDTDPSESREKSCAGNHDHEDHRAFHVQAGESLPMEEGDERRSLFYRARGAFFKGLLTASNYGVKPLGKEDFLFYRR